MVGRPVVYVSMMKWHPDNFKSYPHEIIIVCSLKSTYVKLLLRIVDWKCDQPSKARTAFKARSKYDNSIVPIDHIAHGV